MTHTDTNLASFRGARIVDQYRAAASLGLTVPEKYCLEMVPVASRRSILDVGIGGGRTTKPLSEMFDRYIGIDYSPEMVQAAKLASPEADIRVMDARSVELEWLFDCVLFSFNGIDCIQYEDRWSVLQRIKSQLEPGGYYIYSTHNIHHWRTKVWMSDFWVKELFAPRDHRCLRLVFNRMRKFWQQSMNANQGAAYVNDPASGFALTIVYVDIEKECELLRRNGFIVRATVGNVKQARGYGADDGWVYIVAQKNEK